MTTYKSAWLVLNYIGVWQVTGHLASKKEQPGFLYGKYLGLYYIYTTYNEYILLYPARNREVQLTVPVRITIKYLTVIQCIVFHKHFFLY